MFDWLKEWAKSNPWSLMGAVGLVAGFTALALWLIFNAVFG